MKLNLNHYRHLSNFARLRRESIESAVRFAKKNISPSKTNWLDERFPEVAGFRDIDLNVGLSEPDLRELIQGIFRGIRPVTDGPYLQDFNFFKSPLESTVGIEAEGVRMVDFEKVTKREEAIYPLVADLLPRMELAQYRVYASFNSQFLRLIREPNLFTMPPDPLPTVDAGAYVGYKALALSLSTRRQASTAIELEAENYRLLSFNADLNPGCIRPIRAALANTVGETLRIETRDAQTMAHSLAGFSSLKERGGVMGASVGGEVVETITLDALMSEFELLGATHISVNGFEPEVVEGGVETIRKSHFCRISVPYSRDGISVEDLVRAKLEAAGLNVLGKSGGALLVGSAIGDHHLNP